jgi:hypothetical protein
MWNAKAAGRTRSKAIKMQKEGDLNKNSKLTQRQYTPQSHHKIQQQTIVEAN